MKTYNKGHVTIEFDGTVYLDDTGSYVVVNFRDDYNGLDRYIELKETNITDIVDFLTGTQTKRIPSPIVSKQDMASSGYFDMTPGTKTNFNRLYNMFVIENSDSVYLTKSGNGLTLAAEISERHGFVEQIDIDQVEVNDLGKFLQNINW